MDYDTKAREFVELFAKLIRRPAHRGTEEVTRGEGGILMYLCLQHDGASAGELKKEFEVGSGRIANALRDMEKKGLVTRTGSEDDKRLVLVYATDKGKALVEERRCHIMQKMRELMEELGEEDTDDLIRLLKRILEIYDRHKSHSDDNKQG
jgi:DNA-binding MarR family transcriptional regulator